MAAAIDFKVDFSQMYEMLGAGFAISKIGSGSAYFDTLVQASFINAEKDFNREVIAFAKTSGGLKHMFEWGTIGINDEPTTVKINADDPRARLWNIDFHYYRGEGSIEYDFETSSAIVPKPNATKTGIPQNILDRLKDHVFFNKAEVLEEGIPVTIKPKADNKRKLLFVPNIWKGEQGYSMYSRSTRPYVSRDTKGTFSIFFITWWEQVGSPEMNSDVEKWFQEDLTTVIRDIEHKNAQHPGKPVRNSQGLINRAERTVVKYLKEAAERRVNKRED